MKREQGPLTEALEEMISLLDGLVRPSAAAPKTPGIEWTCYRNPYNSFKDTNNLSLVSFVQIGGLVVLLPGDLERDGWEYLLEGDSFRKDLGSVEVFVASHHGREDGYNDRVFDYCSPSVVVISDSEKRHATQEMVDAYRSHASGVLFNDQDERYVLTTRNDGTIVWNL